MKFIASRLNRQSSSKNKNLEKKTNRKRNRSQTHLISHPISHAKCNIQTPVFNSIQYSSKNQTNKEVIRPQTKRILNYLSLFHYNRLVDYESYKNRGKYSKKIQKNTLNTFSFVQRLFYFI